VTRHHYATNRQRQSQVHRRTPTAAVFGLRKATSAHRGTIATFAESAAGTGNTGNVLDADVLHALISRLAELLDERTPPGLPR
jgi:hypothetical protein